MTPSFVLELFSEICCGCGLLQLILCLSMWRSGAKKTAILAACAPLLDLYYHVVSKEQDALLLHLYVMPLLALSQLTGLLFMLVRRPFTHFVVAALAAAGCVWSMYGADGPSVFEYAYDWNTTPGPHTTRLYKPTHLFLHLFQLCFALMHAHCIKLES